jgi:ArsR family transcriptional regulator, arsenate/arsenite/antimonite-responsive transcriptional repressor / arsenate reductase (thioredoxin)
MIIERRGSIEQRAEAFAALGDPVRLRIVEQLALRDGLPSDLAHQLGIGSNLLAHHLNVLVETGLVRRLRSEGDRRRTYLQLVREAVPALAGGAIDVPARVLFVCTANTARSQLATLLWRAVSEIPATSAGTHPAEAVDPGVIAAAARHGLRLATGSRPRHVVDTREPGDLVVTVCDRAHEELADPAALHWSVPDPVPTGSKHAFEAAVRDLDYRVHGLAERLSTAS